MMRGAMTTVDEVLVPPAGTPLEAPAARRRMWPRLVLGFIVGLVASLALAGGGLLAWDAGYEGRVLPGVHVGDVELSGLDRAQAGAALGAGLAGLADGRVVLRTPAGDVSVAYLQFSRRPDVASLTDLAMARGRTGTPLERAVGEVRTALWGDRIQPAAVLDPQQLSAAVARALGWLEQAPVDAQVIKGSTRIYVIGARPGRTFDASAAAATALAAVRSPDAPREVVVDVPAVAVPPARDDAVVLVAKSAADRMLGRVVVAFKDRKWTIKAATVRRWIRFENAADGSIRPVVNLAAIPSALTKVAKGVRLPPVSATYLRSGRRIVGVAAGKNGRELDRTATAAAIARALTDRVNGAAAAPVSARITRVEPKLTTEEAATKAPIMQRLGSWKTWFPISDHNFFGANIWLPAKIIDGTVLEPGQTFEWWRAVGPVTTARGFGPGGFIAGDHTDPTGALGGGMCSSSTTLFNAALRAGLRMGSRANHQYYINRYPLGLDATVSISSTGTRTMTFTNDMKHPIVIRTYRYTAGGRGWVRYEIWGIPDGRTVSLSRPAVSNLRHAVTSTVTVSTLPHGVREQTEYPADGMDVAVTRLVRDRNGRVIHQETYRSHYQLWNGIIQVGR